MKDYTEECIMRGFGANPVAHPLGFEVRTANDGSWLTFVAHPQAKNMLTDETKIMIEGKPVPLSQAHRDWLKKKLSDWLETL